MATAAAKGRLPVAAALLALVVAAVASFTFASTPPLSPRGAVAAGHFAAAWQRKLDGTYVLDAVTTRTTGSGSEAMRLPTRVVQRPPDRLVIGLGAIDGRLGGKIVRCGPVVAQPCGPSSVDAPPYADDVAAEVDTLRGYLEGDQPLYSVLEYEDLGCFHLALARALPAPPYGDEALFCFDRATGAATTTVVRRGQATERTDATSLRAAVTDADLAIPADLGAPVVVPPATTSTTTTTTR